MPGGRAWKSNRRVTTAGTGTIQKRLGRVRCIHWTGGVYVTGECDGDKGAIHVTCTVRMIGEAIGWF